MPGVSNLQRRSCEGIDIHPSQTNLRCRTGPGRPPSHTDPVCAPLLDAVAMLVYVRHTLVMAALKSAHQCWGVRGLRLYIEEVAGWHLRTNAQAKSYYNVRAHSHLFLPQLIFPQLYVI